MKLSQIIKTARYLQHEQRLIRSSLKALSFRPPFCWLINRRAYQALYQKRVSSRTRPPVHFSSVIIETTNYCNARCIMCPHSQMTRKKGFMSQSLFQKIIHELVDLQPQRLILSGIGEPLADPQIIPRINYAKFHLPRTRVKIFSNISLLTKSKADALVNSGLNDLVVSFNGYQSSYSQVMGLPFKRSLDRLNYLLTIKPKTLHLHLSCMFVTKNTHDIHNLINHLGNRVDSLAINIPENWAGNQSIDTPFHLPYPKMKWPCKGLFDCFNIYWDGSVVLCCRDHNAQLTLGNVNHQSIKDIWQSKQFQEIRQLHLSQQIDRVPICKDCDTPILNATSWW